MTRKSLYRLAAVVLCATLLLAACSPAPTPTAVAPTQAPAKATEPPKPTVAPTAVPATQAPTAAGPCLVVGALYGGPITDAGYNQAMH